MTAASNLFERPPTQAEQFETLLRQGGVHIERIYGPVSSPSEVYDQPHDEWVALLAGEAELELEGATLVTARMGPGDTLFIPAHQRHRVRSASTDALWLAVHLPPR